MDRRDFLKITIAAGTAALASDNVEALEIRHPEEFVGVLVDTTRCIGCRACEVACGKEHGLLVPDVVSDGALDQERRTSERQYTIVNRYETEKGTQERIGVSAEDLAKVTAEEAFEEADLNHDGRLSFEEFQKKLHQLSKEWEASGLREQVR